MPVEQAIPQEDGSVERIIHPGGGQHAIVRSFESDEALEEARARERRAELFDKIKHPLRTLVSTYMVAEGEPDA